MDLSPRVTAIATLSVAIGARKGSGLA